MKKIFILFFALFFVYVVINNGYAEVLWQDDFNGYSSGWKPSDPTAASYFYPNDNSNRLKNYEPSIYPPSQRNNKNSWNGWDRYGDNTIEVVSGEGREGSGCLKIGYAPGTHQHQVGLIKWLGMPGYKELYIRWYFKFDDEWRWGNGTNGSFVYLKTMRIRPGVDLENLNGKHPFHVFDFPYAIVLNWQDDNWGTFSPHVYAKFKDNSTETEAPPCPSGQLGPVCNIQKWWREDNALGQLSYWTGGIDKNGYFVNNGKNGKPGQDWHSIEHHIKLRDTIGTSNAIYEVWIDGQHIGEASSPYNQNPYISADGGLLNWIILADNSDGGDFWDGMKYLYIDDFVVSTTPIGIAGGISKVPSAPHLEIKNN